MLYQHILNKIYVKRRLKVSNFKIEGPILQKDENRGSKTEIMKEKKIYQTVLGQKNVDIIGLK
jgi:hypothetical protein